MNGKRILNELIGIFLVLNIALLTFNIVKTIHRYRINTTRINNVTYALEQKEIYLETQLPRNFTPKSQANLSDFIGSNTTAERDNMVSALFGENSGKVIVTKDSSAPKSIIHRYGSESLVFNKNTIVYTNTDVSESSNKEISLQSAKKICRDFIKRLNYNKKFNNAYIQHRNNEDNIEITFFRNYKGIPVFEEYIRFELMGETIQKATIKIGKISQLDSDRIKKTIYPIDLVLFGIDDELEIEKPMYITDITLGYKAIDESNIMLLGTQLIPTYKIEIRGLKNPIYVNAYTNKRIE